MLKHSVSHYGTTGGLSMPNTFSNSSHSGDGSVPLHRHRFMSFPDEQSQHGSLDPSRLLDGQISPTHGRIHGYLDQSNPRIYLDASRTSRGQGQPHRSSQPMHSTYYSPTSSLPKSNGTVFLTSPHAQFLQHDPNNVTSGQNHSSHHHPTGTGSTFRHGVLRSLALLSVLSLLLALNSLIFLLKIVWPLNMSGGGSESEFRLMYEVTLCLTAMCLSLSLCVLLVTSAQYFFAISGSPGTTSFLQKVTLIRAVATGGFFLSVPIFLAAIVLYTFTHLSFAIPALVTTGIVGLAIIFGGCAMVYHVFTWQKEKTNKKTLIQDVSPNPTLELSTLV